MSEFDERKTRVLVVRPDRLGDVLLSTPVLSVLRQNMPQALITMMIRAEVAPIIRGLPVLDDTMIYDPLVAHAGVRGFFRLVGELRRRKFRIAIVLNSQWKIAAALFLAQIRYRIGPLSKPHSFLFFNRGMRQARSKVEMHEADYNIQLLRRLGIRVDARRVPTMVSVPESSAQAAQDWLSAQGWNRNEPLIVVHPGMGGSALNWPLKHYAEYIKVLSNEGKQVLVTGGPAESALLQEVGTLLGETVRKVWFYGGAEAKSVDFLAGLLQCASLMVASSTGPMHLAVALGKPVLTFYSGVRVQSAIRWGPYVQDDDSASVLVPEVFCGQEFHCIGPLCNYYPCMPMLSVAQALEETQVLLSRTRTTK